MLLTMIRLVTAALLIASAAAFATGAAIEHHTAGSERQTTQRAETGAPGETAGSEEGTASAAADARNSSETLLGIDPEATGLVITAVAVSVVLAVLILTLGSGLLAAVVALAMLAFAALDIREVTHQLNESHPGLAALAVAVAALHLAAAAAALLTARRAPSRHGSSTA